MSNFPEQVQVYLVGGAVRDKLLGLAVKDHDYVVVGATPEFMLEQGFKPVGLDFPVFLHPRTGEEYALARTERKTGQGYHGFSVSFDENVTLEDDLFRRDLTINAMAQNAKGDIIDPYDGQRDIEQKLLRHVSVAFKEDPLRVLRLFRFHAKLAPHGFSIHKYTWQLAQDMITDGELAHLTTERIWLEVTKALVTDAPMVFFQDLYDLNAISELGIDDNLPKETFDNMQSSLAEISEHSLSPAIRFAAWFEPFPSGWEKCVERLPLPRHYQYWMQLFIHHAPTMRHWQQASAEAKWQVFKQSGSLRKKGDIVEFAQALGVNHQSITEMMITQKQLQNIKPQDFMTKGLQGKALGDAIQAAQIRVLSAQGYQV